jgi:hypothetical protein
MTITKVRKDDPAYAVRCQPTGAGRSVLMHLPKPAGTSWPPGCPEVVSQLGNEVWALWIDDDGEVHTALHHAPRGWRHMIAVLRWSLWGQLSGEVPLLVDGPVRGLVLSVSTDHLSGATVGQITVLPAEAHGPSLEPVEALASTRTDLATRVGGGLPPWTGRALACGLLAAGLLAPFVLLAAVFQPLGGDGEQPGPLSIYLVPLLAVAAFLVADRARRESPDPRVRDLLAVVLPWRLANDLVAVRRARRGVVVLPGRSAGAAMVVHPTRPASCPVPPSAEDEWCWWLDAESVGRSFGAPLRWWRRGAAPGARHLLLAASPPEPGQQVRAIVVRRHPGSKALQPPLYITAGLDAGVEAEVARRRALEDLEWRMGPLDPDPGTTWRCVDLMRGGACAAIAFLLPCTVLFAGLLSFGTLVAFGYAALTRSMAIGWRRHRVLVEESGAVSISPEASDADVSAALRLVEQS